ncbi:MAG: hypothetical protein EU518_01440 [Promethearchaeota archaeon]|nr:MAG: hypothetical protein EU518_01440 [Candidatus Lokiarchaeota archaeon]
MTNLIEKILITGFGILLLISFLTIINPFIDLFAKYDFYQEKYEKTIDNINLIDSSIRYSINQNRSYCQEISIYQDLNVSIEKIQIKYEFFINKKDNLILNYDRKMIDGFHLLNSKSNYLLNITLLTSILIKFQILE